MNREKLQSAKKLFFLALGVDILVTGLVVASDLWGTGVLKDISIGVSTADQATIGAFEFWERFAYLMIPTTLGVGLALVKWLNTCYGYAIQAIGASGLKQQSWTLGGWIIPFFNLFKPYQVINEIYKVGDSTYVKSDGWKRVGGSGLLLTWWIFWAVTHLLGSLASKQLIKTALREDMTLDQTIAAIEFHAGFCVVAIVISGFWFIVANALTGRLLGREVVATSAENPTHMADATQSSPNLLRPSLAPVMFASTEIPTKTDSNAVITRQAALQINTAADLPLINAAAATEEDYWATAMTELEGGQRRPGVWAKAYADADGEETKAKVAYLKARVRQLVDAKTESQLRRQADESLTSEEKKRPAPISHLSLVKALENAKKNLSENGWQVNTIRPGCHQVTKNSQTRYFYADQEFIRFADTAA
jgi:hypothetical protein